MKISWKSGEVVSRGSQTRVLHSVCMCIDIIMHYGVRVIPHMCLSKSIAKVEIFA